MFRDATIIRQACLCVMLAFGSVSGFAADWPTHRGNPQRTGSVDGGAGPASPQVAWVVKSTDHFVASPVTDGESVFVSALGAFNTANFQALVAGPAAPNRVRWGKSAPYLKLPTVCAPAIAGGLIVFGDGMHQTDGAVLHGLRADSGLPVWQLPVPGQLVHLEGGPTIVGGKVIIGGGNAGVLCVDSTKLELDGKEVDRATVETQLKKRWSEMVAKYEQEKKVDPDFAIPPSEDALPKPRPKLVWQRGGGQWHVDAPVAVAGQRVLVPSAFLDAEKTGLRALLALNVADGSVAWTAPLTLNPWAGATVAGNVVLIGGSSIRLEPKDVPGARGEVVALDVASGKVQWRKDVPGGVVGSIAVRDNLAVFAATDGKLRGWDVASGADRWTYDAGAAMFASPAIAGNSVYVADLKGVVHAVGLTNGQRQWTLDMAAHPEVQSAAQVYGSPIVSGGRLYVATCNLAAPGERRATAVVCIGPK